MKRKDDPLKKADVPASTFEMLFRKHNAIMLLIDGETGKLIDVNDAALRFYGYSLPQMMSMKIEDINQLPLEQQAAEKRRIFSEGQVFSIAQHKLANGEVRSVEINTVPVSFNNKTYFSSVIHDITSHVKAEEALKKSETLLKTQLEHSPDVIMVLDREYRFVTINKVQHTHNTVEKLIGHDSILILPEKVQPQVRERVQACFETGEIQQFEHLVGEDKWAMARVVPLSTDGVINQVMVISTDITERKRVEDALQESEGRFRTIFEQSHLGIVINSPSFAFEKTNPAFRRMIGYSEDELRTMTFADITHPEHIKEDIDNVKKVASGEIPFYQTEKRYIHKTGSILWGEMTVSSIRDRKGRIQYYLAMVIDITKRKQVEEEKAELQTRLQQSHKMESIGRLAGGVAHDFNNMLGVIIGNTEMALDEVQPEQPIYSDLMEIQKAAERSADLTRQLLAFARKQTVSPKQLDLNSIIDGMLKMLNRIIGENIRLNFQPATGLWPVKIDPTQFDQILVNLCVNAGNAISDVGEISIMTENRVLNAESCAYFPDSIPGEYVKITVQDNGHGMERQTLEHIFEPFYTTKNMGSGTGLGLATVYGAVRQNNGFIHVDSEPEKGTAFEIYLPRSQHGAAQVTGLESTGPAAGRSRETILLVEDESALLALLCRILESKGYTVLTAQTPGAAIQLAREYTGKINLLITDVVMPEMNGRDLARNLLTLCPNLKRLFMSGYTADIIANHGVLEEGVFFIQKPLTRNELLNKVQEVMDHT